MALPRFILNRTFRLWPYLRPLSNHQQHVERLLVAVDISVSDDLPWFDVGFGRIGSVVHGQRSSWPLLGLLEATSRTGKQLMVGFA